MNDNGRDRPIDNYPRIRDTFRFVLFSGVFTLVVGLWQVYRAWRGIDPGQSALIAFLFGMLFMVQSMAWLDQ